MPVLNGEKSLHFPQAKTFRTPNLVEIVGYSWLEPNGESEPGHRDYPYKVIFYTFTTLVYKVDQSYRVEVIDDEHEFYYHTGIFSSVDDAVGFAQKCFYYPNPCALWCDEWLGSLHSDIEDYEFQFYKGWFIFSDGWEYEAYDPLTNRQYIREALPEIYKLIDTIQAARCKPSLVLV